MLRVVVGSRASRVSTLGEQSKGRLLRDGLSEFVGPFARCLELPSSQYHLEEGAFIDEGRIALRLLAKPPGSEDDHHAIASALRNPDFRCYLINGYLY